MADALPPKPLAMVVASLEAGITLAAVHGEEGWAHNFAAVTVFQVRKAVSMRGRYQLDRVVSPPGFFFMLQKHLLLNKG